jgi:hypothetical protein
MEPEPSTGGMSRVSVAILAMVVLVVGGFLAVVIPRAHEAARFVQTMNNLKQIALAIEKTATQHDSFAPPGVGVFAGREGTLFFHILPYLEAEDAWANDRTGEWLKVYSSSSDGSFPEGKPWTSFAWNTGVFAVRPQALYDYDELCGDRGFANTIILMERFAVASGHVHAWADMSEGATYLDGPASSVEYGVKPEQARNDTAHAMTRWGCQVAVSDASVRKITPQMSTETFRWACNPKAPPPPPSDWEQAPRP